MWKKLLVTFIKSLKIPSSVLQKSLPSPETCVFTQTSTFQKQTLTYSSTYPELWPFPVDFKYVSQAQRIYPSDWSENIKKRGLHKPVDTWKTPHTNNTTVSYIHVLLGEVLGVFSHHVGQVPLPDVKLLHLLLDELHRELLRPCSRQVLPAVGRAHTNPPAQHLERTTGGRCFETCNVGQTVLICLISEATPH